MRYMIGVSMSRNNRAVGSRGEAIATWFLKKNGYEILDRNYWCRLGEIDIIGKDGDYLVFIEVKYRKDIKTGYPSEAVGYYKQQRIIKTAMHYAKVKGLFRCNVRFDVVEIVDKEIRVIKNAFSC